MKFVGFLTIHRLKHYPCVRSNLMMMMHCGPSGGPSGHLSGDQSGDQSGGSGGVPVGLGDQT